MPEKRKKKENADKFFHGEREQYESIDDLIQKSMEDRKKLRKKQLGN